MSNLRHIYKAATMFLEKKKVPHSYSVRDWYGLQEEGSNICITLPICHMLDEAYCQGQNTNEGRPNPDLAHQPWSKNCYCIWWRLLSLQCMYLFLFIHLLFWNMTLSANRIHFLNSGWTEETAQNSVPSTGIKVIWVMWQCKPEELTEGMVRNGKLKERWCWFQRTINRSMHDNWRTLTHKHMRARACMHTEPLCGMRLW
jgi:hypothetical protein